MTRLMFDGVDPSTVPAGAALYAGYVDGQWQSYTALVAAHPAARHVTICVSTLDDAQVLDVETGDATPEQAPGWAEHQRSRGNPYPAIYMDETAWPAVQKAFADQAVAAPLYWVAAYVDEPTQPVTIPDGAIAVQFYDYGGYDASLVADYWPGVDPEPVPAVSPTTVLEEDSLNTTSSNGRAGLTWAAGSRHVVQVGYDPAAGDPKLRVLLTLTTGPWVAPAAMTFPAGSGTGTYEIPQEYIATCRGVILEALPGSPQVVYDVTAV